MKRLNIYYVQFKTPLEILDSMGYVSSNPTSYDIDQTDIMKKPQKKNIAINKLLLFDSMNSYDKIPNMRESIQIEMRIILNLPFYCSIFPLI